MTAHTQCYAVIRVEPHWFLSSSVEMRVMKTHGWWLIPFKTSLTSPVISCPDVLTEQFIYRGYFYFHFSVLRLLSFSNDIGKKNWKKTVDPMLNNLLNHHSRCGEKEARSSQHKKQEQTGHCNNQRQYRGIRSIGPRLLNVFACWERVRDGVDQENTYRYLVSGEKWT